MKKTTTYVRWNDASMQDGPTWVDKLDPACPHEACGFLVKETDDHISLALDYSQNGEGLRYVLHIPKSLITYRKALK